MKRLLPFAVVLVLAAGCGGSHQASGSCPSGSSEVILKAVPNRGLQITPQLMQTAQAIIVRRVDQIGVSSPNVAIQGSNEIVIQLAGVHNPAKTAAIIGSTGQLQFFDFERDLAPPTVNGGTPTPYGSLYDLLRAVKSQASKGTPQAYYLFGTKKTTEKNAILAGPDPTRKQLLSAYGGNTPSGDTILAVPAHLEAVSGTLQGAAQPVGTSPTGKYWYLFKYNPTAPNGPPEISGSDLNESAITADTGQANGQPEVTLAFNSHGAEEFQAITKAEYERGQLVAGLHGSATQLNQLYAQHNAIVLDNKLQATPYIDYTDNSLSLGIAGATAVISNMGSIEAANNLALVLQSGSLPYTFQRVSLPICSS